VKNDSFQTFLDELFLKKLMNTAFYLLPSFPLFLPIEPEEKSKDIVNNTMPESKDTGEVFTRRTCLCLCVDEGVQVCVIHELSGISRDTPLNVSMCLMFSKEFVSIHMYISSHFGPQGSLSVVTKGFCQE